MCVIIVREPGITLPFEKLKSACKVNGHGWGLAIADRGKIELRKELYEHGNDPEVIAEALDDAKDQLLMLHLRFVTVGDKSLPNCHPFQILSNKEDGIDVVMAHNGTLYQFKDPNDGGSDTKHFAEQFVQPLFKRIVKFTGPQHVLQDDFAMKLLDYKINTSSVVTFLDGNNNVHTFNESQGKKFEGWWASNEYSFQEDHREPAKTTNASCSYGGYYGSQYSDSDYEDQTDDLWKAHTSNTGSTTTTTPRSSTIIIPQSTLDPDIDIQDHAEDAENIRKVLSMKDKNPSAHLIRLMLNEKRPSFCELTGIQSLKEMTRFDPDDLAEFCDFYTELTVTLIQDLLYELYLKDHKPILTAVVDAPKMRTEKPILALPAPAANGNAETANVATSA